MTASDDEFPDLKISAAIEPGLSELIDSGAATSDQDVGALVRRFVTTPGIAGTDFAVDVQDTLDQSLSAGEGLRWVSILDALRNIFTSSTIRVVGTEDVELAIAAYYLSVPAAHASSVTLTVETSTDAKKSGSVKIFGCGGGVDATLTVKNSFSRTATKSEQIVVKAPAVMEIVEVIDGKGNRTTFPRLRSVHTDQCSYKFSIWTPVPPTTIGPPVQTEKWDLTEGGGSVKTSVELDRNLTWNSTIGVKVDSIGLDASLSIEGQYSRTTTFDYVLDDKHIFVGSRYRDLPAFFWTVDGHS